MKKLYRVVNKNALLVAISDNPDLISGTYFSPAYDFVVGFRHIDGLATDGQFFDEIAAIAPEFDSAIVTADKVVLYGADPDKEVELTPLLERLSWVDGIMDIFGDVEKVTLGKFVIGIVSAVMPLRSRRVKISREGTETL